MILIGGWLNLLLKGELVMSKVIKGKRCFLVDIDFDEYFIYEIYEDEQGNKYKVKIDYRRF